MRIGLVSYRCENGDTGFNMSQIERAMREAQGKADLLCFGEAFLQGFDSLCWDYGKDIGTAVEQSSETVSILRQWTVRYGVALLTGYIEKEGETLYSSCMLLSDGDIVHNYRRISKGWKEYSITDGHYAEGTESEDFFFRGKRLRVALCGDLWDHPERFRTDGLLIWPVYVNYPPEEWEGGAAEEYAAQAALAADDALMVNPLDRDPECHGGAFRFSRGRIADRIPFDTERILIVDTD